VNPATSTNISPAPSELEAAAVIAAIARLQRDFAPANPADAPQAAAWQRAALAEGVNHAPLANRSWSFS